MSKVPANLASSFGFTGRRKSYLSFFPPAAAPSTSTSSTPNTSTNITPTTITTASPPLSLEPETRTQSFPFELPERQHSSASTAVIARDAREGEGAGASLVDESPGVSRRGKRRKAMCSSDEEQEGSGMMGQGEKRKVGNGRVRMQDGDEEDDEGDEAVSGARNAKSNRRQRQDCLLDSDDEDGENGAAAQQRAPMVRAGGGRNGVKVVRSSFFPLVSHPSSSAESSSAAPSMANGAAHDHSEGARMQKGESKGDAIVAGRDGPAQSQPHPYLPAPPTHSAITTSTTTRASTSFAAPAIPLTTPSKPFVVPLSRSFSSPSKVSTASPDTPTESRLLQPSPSPPFPARHHLLSKSPSASASSSYFAAAAAKGGNGAQDTSHTQEQQHRPSNPLRTHSQGEREDKVELLHEMFPNFDVDVVRSVFAVSGDMNAAVTALFDMASATPKKEMSMESILRKGTLPPRESVVKSMAGVDSGRVAIGKGGDGTNGAGAAAARGSSRFRLRRDDSGGDGYEDRVATEARASKSAGGIGFRGEMKQVGQWGGDGDLLVSGEEEETGNGRNDEEEVDVMVVKVHKKSGNAEKEGQAKQANGSTGGKSGSKKKEVITVKEDEEDGEEEDEERDGGETSEDEDAGHGRPPEFLQKLVDFFNTASKEELERCPRCTAIRASAIISGRPYADYDHLWETFESRRGLSTSMIESLSEQWESLQAVDTIMEDCEGLSRSIRDLVTSLHPDNPKETTELPIGRPNTIPKHMHLQHYQLVGLNWLCLLHKHNINAILADEMGLGKTVQSISFLAHLLAEGDAGPHLIVVPASTLDNWGRELERWCPDLEVVRYQGSQAERYALQDELLASGRRRRSFHVLLTTYNTAAGGPNDRQFLRKFTFSCIIFDEGHMLKDMKTQRYTHLVRLKGRRRVLLTGTPVQNNLVELMSLLTFVMPRVFRANSDQLKAVFSRGADSKEQAALVAAATRIMAPFVLRRTKDAVALQLPSKELVTVDCPLTPFQLHHYNRLIVEYRMQKSSPDGDQTRIANLFMQLRKMALHPLLHRCRYTDDILPSIARGLLRTEEHQDGGYDAVLEDLTYMSDFEIHQFCMRHDILTAHRLDSSTVLDAGKCIQLQAILKEKKAKGERVLIFSQFTSMLDILELFLDLEQHTYLRLDGQTPVEERQSLIDEFTENPGIFVFLLSTKAGGLGINLTAANVVVLHDMDFNPHNDKQAEDRCHRLGQTKTVEVVRLVAPDTVEAVMMKMAHDKLRLDAHLTSGKSEGVDGGLMEALRRQHGL